MPCGSTGEAATLSHEEHARVIRFVVERARDRVPIIAGAGSNSTTEAIALTTAAKDAGAAATLSISPYYNKPDQEGLVRHYGAVADAVRLPLIVYNIPVRTASRIEAATIARLAEHPGIVGLKESDTLDHALDVFHARGRSDRRLRRRRRGHVLADGARRRRRDLDDREPRAARDGRARRRHARRASGSARGRFSCGCCRSSARASRRPTRSRSSTRWRGSASVATSSACR